MSGHIIDVASVSHGFLPRLLVQPMSLAVLGVSSVSSLSCTPIFFTP